MVLRCTRAKDEDTRTSISNPSQSGTTADTMHPDWPRWTASAGSFKDDDFRGTSVVWYAPEFDNPSIEVKVYENDKPTEFCHDEDTGTRDDDEILVDTRTVAAMRPIVAQITFSNANHNLVLSDGSDHHGWGSTSSPIPHPEYDVHRVPTSQVSQPALYAKSSRPSLTVRCYMDAAPAVGVTFALEAVGAGTAMDFGPTAGFEFQAGEQHSTAQSVLATEDLADEVAIHDGSFDLAWFYTVPSGTNQPLGMPVTDHTLYATYAAPMGTGNVPTTQRVSWVCTEADGRNTPEQVADGIHAGLAGDPPYEPGEKTTVQNGWPLMDGAGDFYGECDEQAGLMQVAMNMVGISASTALVRASTNAGVGNCLDQEGRPSGTGYTQWLILDFNASGAHDWNAFEGCCIVAGHYYAVWPSLKATDDYDMLKNEVPGRQFWVKTHNNIEPGYTGWWPVEAVFEEVPKP